MTPNFIRQAVIDHQEDFMRLFTNYSSLYDGLLIRKSKKVFYSDTERKYYERNMTEDLVRNYQALYHKYISTKYPELSIYSRLLLPRTLAEILDKA